MTGSAERGTDGPVKHEMVSTVSVNMGSLLGTTLVATCSCGEKVNVQNWAEHFDPLPTLPAAGTSP